MTNTKKPTYNKKEYEKNNFKYQNVCFKLEEIEAIDAFCQANGESRNGLIRKAVMEYIENPIQ